MRFYLGTHETSWLGRDELAGVPLFVSAHRLRRRPATRRRWRRAVTRWVVDSGGFTRLFEHGFWDITPEAYAAEVREWRGNIGGLDWSAVQDWMCEDIVCASVGVREGLLHPDADRVEELVEQWVCRHRGRQPRSADRWVIQATACLPLDPAWHAARVVVHQTRTIDSYLALRRIAPDLPFVPVLQGQPPEDYFRHVRMYADAGVDLTSLDTVGVGSVCRRQATAPAEAIMEGLAGMGIRTHGFGFKIGGLENCWPFMRSADSLAWSYRATKIPPMDGCTHAHCQNCLRYALHWRSVLLARMNADNP